nr:class I SAM-dependent methyltransferase [Kibdelosporangium sp. MJ126-NF4]CEL17826.1 N, N-dimethyltransferase [Kibdelosporangium sp. MJ126-NF4]CTQ90950.1 N, N-dimethyltransferase [Kibdelosporangium sp. MJ126-NF4]
MYGHEIAQVYDIIYRQRKDYPAEADGFATLVADRFPAATSLLDVACGTGEHLVYLRKVFARVEGLDLSGAMCDVARAKLPGVPIHQADMRTFQLDRRFDAVICPFSSIAHAGTPAELDAAIGRMAAHVERDGILVVEPWLFPETLAGARPQMHTATSGQLAHDVVEHDGRMVATVSHFSLSGRTAHMDVHHLFGEATGVRHFADALDMTLFERAEYEAAFERAGCSVEYYEGSPWARGVFVGIQRR